MKTKEEIIWSYEDKRNPGYYHECNVEQMMDAYARQIALAFCATEEGVSPESLAANFDRFMKREGMV